MRRARRLSIVLSFAVSLGFAGPPGNAHHQSGGGEFYSRGPISGPAPVGASGSAPIGASGSFLPSRTGFRNGSVGLGGGFRDSSVGLGGGFRSGMGGQGGGRRGDDDRGEHHHPGSYFSPYAFPYLIYDNSYGSYDNSYGYGSGNGYGANAPADPATQDLLMGQDQLGQQVQQLSAEINQLKSQQQQQPPQLAPSPMAPSAAPEQDAPIAVPLTLVLQSGQQIQVKNYAVMDGVFWDFSKQPARKIPVSAINVDASVKATQDKGGDFPDLGK